MRVSEATGNPHWCIHAYLVYSCIRAFVCSCIFAFLCLNSVSNELSKPRAFANWNRYWDEGRHVWDRRGLLLRGLSVAPTEPSGGAGVDVVTICVSSHLTKFAVEDDTEIADALEDRMRVRLCKIHIPGLVIGSEIGIEDSAAFVFGIHSQIVFRTCAPLTAYCCGCSMDSHPPLRPVRVVKVKYE